LRFTIAGLNKPCSLPTPSPSEEGNSANEQSIPLLGGVRGGLDLNPTNK